METLCLRLRAPYFYPTTKGDQDNMANVWYVGYGSNLHEQRFLCYISGGTPRFGAKANKGCTDKAPPTDNKPMIIPHKLYFALPGSNTSTSNWGTGGVAFIDPNENKNVRTFCRMWKLTTQQYQEVRSQEGCSWYNREIVLGHDCGIPIYTITNGAVLTNVLCPSDAYIKTIVLGLRETYNLTDKDIAQYLMDKDGIRGTPQANTVPSIVASV